MRIVTDGFGAFAIQKGLIFKRYIDLQFPFYNWKKSSQFYCDCWGTYEEALRAYHRLKPKKVDLKELNPKSNSYLPGFGGKDIQQEFIQTPFNNKEVADEQL